MSSNRRKFFLLFCASVAAFIASTSISDNSQALASGKQPQIQGRLVSMVVPSRTANIRLTSGQVVSIFIPLAAKVERNGVRVSLAAFRPNDRVQAKFTADRSTVVKFEGTGP